MSSAGAAEDATAAGEGGSRARWPTVMLLLLYGSRLVTVPGDAPQLSGISRFFANGDKTTRLSLKVTGTFFLLFLVIAQHHIFVPYARFAKNLVRPVVNEQVLSPDIVELGSTIRAAKDDCYFNWVNDGILAFLSGKRLCSS